MKTNQKIKATQSRNIQIILQIENEQDVQKLKQFQNNLPCWVLGEEISRKLNQGRKTIEINLSELFALHQL